MTASPSSARRLSVVGALTVVLALAACTPASATDVRVRHSFFGLHDASLLASGTVHEGAVRLWDVGVQWQQIETHQNGRRYDWSRLDRVVSAARQAGAEITMVIGMTPSFYASAPTQPPRRMARYRDFVRALMKRYHSRIGAYQVWNEPNISTFWTGTVRRMAAMTKTVHDLRDRFAPRSKVIAPSLVTRLPYQLTWLSSYYRQRVGGRPLWRYVDAVAVSLYPLPRTGGHLSVPEDTMPQLAHVRRLLGRAGVPRSKPVWNTEINYGLQTGARGGTSAARISAARQASNVVRTYLLNAAAGVKRVFWYRYDWGRLSDGGTLGNTLLTDPDSVGTVIAAGHAYARVQKWMHGTLVGTHGRRPCASNRQGTYTCVVRDSTGTRRIYWNPFGTGRVRLARNAHHLTGVLGGVTTVKPRSTITVGFRPVMASR